MSKLLDVSVEAVMNLDTGAPVRFKLHGRWRKVTHVLHRWRVRVPWWQGGGLKECFHVVTASGGVYELCCFERKWQVKRCFD